MYKVRWAAVGRGEVTSEPLAELVVVVVARVWV